MAEYQVISENAVLRVEDQAGIPNDPDNVDWQKYQQWLTEGGVPDQLVPLPPPEES